jgi:hypothetical protein
MRIRVRPMVYLVAVSALVGCSAGISSSTTHHPVTTSSSSAATAARATVTLSATASPSLGSATASPSLGLLGVLPVPADAMPWPGNTNALVSLVSYVRSTYIKRVWAEEEALNARRGFVSAVEEGWTNPNGSGQYIALVRFATPVGAMSEFDEQISGWEQTPGVTALGGLASGFAGFRMPTLDAQGNADVDFYVVVGETLIRVVEYTAATPDPAAAKILLQEQYDRLKNGS